jgi:hypothetical protein
MYQGLFEQARTALEKSRSLNASLAWNHLYLAGVHALVGDRDESRSALEEAQRLSPGLTSIVRYKSISQIAHAKLQALRDDTLIRGLRLAGLPDE